MTLKHRHTLKFSSFLQLRMESSTALNHIIVSLPSLVSPVTFAATGLCCFLVGVQCFVCVWRNKHTCTVLPQTHMNINGNGLNSQNSFQCQCHVENTDSWVVFLSQTRKQFTDFEHSGWSSTGQRWKHGERLQNHQWTLVEGTTTLEITDKLGLLYATCQVIWMAVLRMWHASGKFMLLPTNKQEHQQFLAVTLISRLNLCPVNFFVLPENQTAATKCPTCGAKRSVSGMLLMVEETLHVLHKLRRKLLPRGQQWPITKKCICFWLRVETSGYALIY